MKKRLLKRLTSIAVTVAMTVAMITGFSADVKAAEMTESEVIALVDKYLGELRCDDSTYPTARDFITINSRSTCSTFAGFIEMCYENHTTIYDIDNYSWTTVVGEETIVQSVTITGKHLSVHLQMSAFTEAVVYTCTILTPDPTPAPEPKKAEIEEKEKPAKEVDRDTFKSEAPYGTAGITNSNSKVGDLKVHKVNAITETNQKLLADAFAKQHGKRARILTTVSLHPRRELGVDNGKKEDLIYSNLEKNPQTVFAVCYNQTDKAYYLTGTLDKNGVATFPDFILRDATNVTIFVLE